MTMEQKSFLLGYSMRSAPFGQADIMYEQNDYGQTAILVFEEENDNGTTLRIGGKKSGVQQD